MYTINLSPLIGTDVRLGQKLDQMVTQWEKLTTLIILKTDLKSPRFVSPSVYLAQYRAKSDNTANYPQGGGSVNRCGYIQPDGSEIAS